jgi:hypothetical protein
MALLGDVAHIERLVRGFSRDHSKSPGSWKWCDICFVNGPQASMRASNKQRYTAAKRGKSRMNLNRLTKGVALAVVV